MNEGDNEIRIGIEHVEGVEIACLMIDGQEHMRWQLWDLSLLASILSLYEDRLPVSDGVEPTDRYGLVMGALGAAGLLDHISMTRDGQDVAENWIAFAVTVALSVFTQYSEQPPIRAEEPEQVNAYAQAARLAYLMTYLRSEEANAPSSRGLAESWNTAATMDESVDDHPEAEQAIERIIDYVDRVTGLANFQVAA